MKLSILMAIANSSPVSPIMHWMIFPSKWRTRNLFSISANANDFMFSCIIMAFHVIVDFVWWCTVDMLRLVNFLAAPEALKRGLHQLEFMAHTCHGTYLSFLCANVGNCQTSSTSVFYWAWRCSSWISIWLLQSFLTLWNMVLLQII